MARPAADWEVDEALVAALVEEQAPELAGPVRHLGGGWDNELFRVGEGALARLPRREVAVELVRHEHRFLPTLPPLPLPIPRPLVCGRPSARFERPWSVVPYFEGRSAVHAALGDPLEAGRTLGAFLRALHVPAPADAPRNPFRSIPLRERAERVERSLAALGDAVDRAAIGRAWRGLAPSEAPGPPVWIHGDLHADNVLVRDGAPCAVIDFGDLCAGDRATDLALGWMLFEAPARDAFFDAAGVSSEDQTRSRGWALALALVHAAASEPGAFRDMGLRAIERCVRAR